MARATLPTVQRMVYENLAVSPTYGTLDTTNKRYVSSYINDAIASMDIRIINLLLKHKQHILLTDLETTQAVNSGDVVDNNWSIIKVDYYTDTDGNTQRAVEITWDDYQTMRDGVDGIFNTTSYSGYFTIKDGIIYVIPSATYSGNTAVITYINLTHPSTLSALNSPTGFESVVSDLATAKLLLRRMDKPQEAQVYMESAYRFLQEFGIPQYAMQTMVDKP